MISLWTPEERRFLRSLSSPRKIQDYLDSLIYNPDDSCLSARYVMMTGEGHCLEGGLVAAAAFEMMGQKPLMVDLVAHDDDHHVLTVYRGLRGWGSVSKSNTVLLRSRTPIYRSIRELVMSYFDFYFNTNGALSLSEYSAPINLNRYNHWNWRTGDENLMEMGMSFAEEKHFVIATEAELRKEGRVSSAVKEACFLGADPAGLF